MPSIMNVSAEITGRLELFRTRTLADMLSPDDKDAPTSAMESYMDNLMPDNIQIPDIPVVNSRAGLYIHLSALV